ALINLPTHRLVLRSGVVTLRPMYRNKVLRHGDSCWLPWRVAGVERSEAPSVFSAASTTQSFIVWGLGNPRPQHFRLRVMVAVRGSLGGVGVSLITLASPLR